MQLLLTSAAPSNIGQGGDTIIQTQNCVSPCAWVKLIFSVSRIVILAQGPCSLHTQFSKRLDLCVSSLIREPLWCRGLLCVRDMLCECCVRVGVCGCVESWFLLSFTRACFEFLTTLTFRALHGDHIASTPLQTIVEEDKHKKHKKSSPTCPSTP